MSLTTQRPLPPAPKQTAPSSSTSFPPDQPETPAPEESADVHMADPNSTDLSFEAMLQAQDVAMTPAQELYPDPMDTSTSPTHFASLNTPGVRLACSSRDIQGEVVSVRVCGGASN